MRIPNANNEVLLFWGELIKVIAFGTFAGDAASVGQRVEDEGGNDITRRVRSLSVSSDMRRCWAQVELDAPGFDGPFCTPQVGFDLLISNAPRRLPGI